MVGSPSFGKMSMGMCRMARNENKTTPITATTTVMGLLSALVINPIY